MKIKNFGFNPSTTDDYFKSYDTMEEAVQHLNKIVAKHNEQIISYKKLTNNGGNIYHTYTTNNNNVYEIIQYRR